MLLFLQLFKEMGVRGGKEAVEKTHVLKEYRKVLQKVYKKKKKKQPMFIPGLL